jgi:hypothetical protein
MKKLLVMILMAFTFSLFSSVADAGTETIGAPVKFHKKHRWHHRWHWHHRHHHHHRHHRKIITIKR